MKKFGKVKVKNMIPVKKRLRGHMPLEEIPDDCGYDKKFKFDIIFMEFLQFINSNF